MQNRQVRMNGKTNLLELEEHMYPLVDVETQCVHGICSLQRGAEGSF